MKKTIIAVFAVLAVASVAGAQEAAWNFEGRNGAAVPLPTMERAIMPQRLVSMDGMSEEKLGALLKKAARSQNKSTITCSFAGPINLGDMICGSECCLVDMDNDGEGDTTDCHPIMPCFPVEKPDTKTARKPKISEDCVFSCSSAEYGCLDLCQTISQSVVDNCKGDNCAELARAGLEKCEGMCFTGAAHCLKGCVDSKRPARTKGR